MNDEEDGDTLSVSQEEQLKKFIARMNVFSQHKKVIAEIARLKKRGRKRKG